MRIPLTEPFLLSNYIYINPTTNKVHLMVPVVYENSITSIVTTDSIRGAVEDLSSSFKRLALRALTVYKEALVFDIEILNVSHTSDADRAVKEARLIQIETYIKAVQSMSDNPLNAILSFLKKPSNLYRIELRLGAEQLSAQSRQLPIMSSVFTNHVDDTPQSSLYRAMLDEFPKVNVADKARTEDVSAFYIMSSSKNPARKAEQLSILTQYFLANLNVYCSARGISNQNFGLNLDQSPTLSECLVRVVSTALTGGEDVEKAIFDFFNEYSSYFGLVRALHEDDLKAILERFKKTYSRVINEANHNKKDDFMILDGQATGERAKFVIYQGLISFNFAELIEPMTACFDQEYFASILADFTDHPAERSCLNKSVACYTEVDVDEMGRLPTKANDTRRAHPDFQVCQFLEYVAKGKQEKAAALLTATPGNTQTLLRTRGVFMDYSGRAFKCTAYEYAYWAKDTHMCRMLEAHMDEETNGAIAERIDEMERIDVDTGNPVGLLYVQFGQIRRGVHFDFTPLKKAYQCYLDAYQDYLDAYNLSPTTTNLDAVRDAWWAVGKAQRDVPAHVAQEYCRQDRSFNPRPEFNEPTLPRVLTYYNGANFNDSWFPLAASDSGLGFKFVFLVGGGVVCDPVGPQPTACVNIDLAAVSHLDEVRTTELGQMRDDLRQASSRSMIV